MNTVPSDQINILKSLLAEFPILQVVSVYRLTRGIKKSTPPIISLLIKVDMLPSSVKTKRTITAFMLAMINIAAIGSVKNWALTAEYGFSSIIYILIAALVFFIPTALVSAELATGWPEAGGVFVWVKRAFGHRTGFLAIWLLWVQNLFWYPTILSFIAVALAYIINPALANNTVYNTAVILIAFWGATLVNLLEMRVSASISSLSVVFGTFIPGGLIILLGLIWYLNAEPLQITFSWAALFPSITSAEQLVFLTGVILSLCGIEMSAVHARNVLHPKRDYPKAILISSAIIIGSSILGVLAIAIVIPQKQIGLASGALQAFSYFANAYQIHWITPLIAGLMLVGALGAMSTWIIGPAKGLLAAAQSGDLPPYFREVNKNGMPKRLLFAQGTIVSLISLIFLWMPTVSAGFWILSAMNAQIYLVMYLLLFATAIRLRYTHPEHERPYEIPGGKAGMWAAAGLGIAGSLFAMGIGFFPPSQIKTVGTPFYMSFVALITALMCTAPSLILLFQKPSWKKPLEHEKAQKL